VSEGNSKRKTQRVTLASKFYNRAVTPCSGIRSPVAQQPGNNGMRQETDEGGVILSLSLSLPLSPLSGLLRLKRESKRDTDKFFRCD